MIIRSILALADVELPGVQGLNAQPPRATHVQPALVAVAVLALAIVGFLVYDLFRQKRNERRERAKLERFREKRLRQSEPATPSGEANS